MEQKQEDIGVVDELIAMLNEEEVMKADGWDVDFLQLEELSLYNGQLTNDLILAAFGENGVKMQYPRDKKAACFIEKRGWTGEVMANYFKKMEQFENKKESQTSNEPGNPTSTNETPNTMFSHETANTFFEYETASTEEVDVDELIPEEYYLFSEPNNPTDMTLVSSLQNNSDTPKVGYYSFPDLQLLFPDPDDLSFFTSVVEDFPASDSIGMDWTSSQTTEKSDNFESTDSEIGPTQLAADVISMEDIFPSSTIDEGTEAPLEFHETPKKKRYLPKIGKLNFDSPPLSECEVEMSSPWSSLSSSSASR